MRKTLLEPLYELEEFYNIQKDLKHQGGPVYISGCMDSQKAHFIEALAQPYKYRLIVTHSDLAAKKLYEDYRFFSKETLIYPAKDVIFYSADIHGNLLVRQRLGVIERLLEERPTTVITTIDALFDHILPLEVLKKNVLTLGEGDRVDLGGLQKRLTAMGFDRVSQVEEPGQFALRGGILDVYNMAQDCPYRLEFWDDEIDSIRSFDVESQRSMERCETLKIYPASELILTETMIGKGLAKIEKDKDAYVKILEKNKNREAALRLKQIVSELKDRLENGYSGANLDSYIRYFAEETVSFADYFKEDSVIFLDEPARLLEKCETVSLEFNESMTGRLEKGYILKKQMEVLFDYREILHKVTQGAVAMVSTLDQRIKELTPATRYSLNVRSVNPYNSNFEMLTKELARWKKSGYRMVVVANSKTRAMRLAANLQEYELAAFYSEDMDRMVQPGEIMIIHGNLHQGMEYPLIHFVIIAESDIFGEEKKKRRRKQEHRGQRIASFGDLAIGDYVVHENHGLGVYRGLESIEVDGVVKDYIKIEYAGGSNLYILATQLDMIQKFAGGESKAPKLNKLGGQEWGRTKSRVRSAVRVMAEDLVELYAKRQAEQGFQFGPDTVWQREFEEVFPYEETQDQLTAIEETKKDMESTKIMDRLICGDVGYGKTEIAIRAAFKAVQDGKQVVVLVPTTILAQQHYNTFVQRMKDYPINIALMSRFRTKTEQTKTIEGLKKGLVDIVIGTHRVLSKDMAYKNLGLLVVDEEQRFGVTHKEKIKKMKETVDVLTLTATPIPRTLHMSLIGIRDMSILEEPPVDRLPIQTYVMEFNEEMIREAINRELGRGGQVYYVYNRVNTISEIANMVSRMVPDANVAFAHGQMNERELEKIMYGFINGEIDVLVSTTIIETGLDISNVNTMIIHDADKMGLSQLYQLRGRVGRSNRTSYAFLMYKRDKVLREIAEKRLSAIKEFTELGSGFKIAMRDLEIRGAGTLLGEQQSGHMEAVGYDLYCKMLGEAVKQAKGEVALEEFETTIEVDLDAYIPAAYIRNEYQKLDIYKRIAAIANEEEYDEMADELMDRFGELPKPAQNLLAVALLKALAHEAGIEQLSHKDNVTKLVMFPRAAVDVEKIPALLKKYRNAMKFVPGAHPYFTVKIKDNPKLGLVGCEKILINDIKGLLI